MPDFQTYYDRIHQPGSKVNVSYYLTAGLITRKRILMDTNKPSFMNYIIALLPRTTVKEVPQWQLNVFLEKSYILTGLESSQSYLLIPKQVKYKRFIRCRYLHG